MTQSNLRTIVLVGFLGGPTGKQKCAYLERLEGELLSQGFSLLLIEQFGREIETACRVHRLPEGMAEGELSLSDSLRQDWQTTPRFQHAVDVDAAHFTIDEEEAARRCLIPAQHIGEVLVRKEAALCILWHQFNGGCFALEEYCIRLNIPTLFAHLGPLPGTITFEPGGQMAESWPCRENQRFLDLPLTQADRDTAKAYLEYARETRADRKFQTTEHSIILQAKELQSQESDVLFYAGQNDFRSGMSPRNLPSATLHSPNFSSTYDALDTLSDIASEHHWGLLFKPHPNVPAPTQARIQSKPNHVTLVEHANIFECIQESSVTVTILSTAAYLALIHDRPVLLLGCMTLSGKGCAYEAPSPDVIPTLIERAMRDGFTPAQQEHWLTHVAQLIRYYLFSFDQPSSALIGRDVDNAALFIAQHSLTTNQ